MDGGYDNGYKSCSCFWGREPGSLVKLLARHLNGLRGLYVLDAGCGEGKNSTYLASKGAFIDALDISEHAIGNARMNWPSSNNINWQVADIREVTFPKLVYDIVIAYGILHCLSNSDQIAATINKLKSAAKPGGYNMVCAFNSRYQDLRAHPDFSPCLVNHDFYTSFYTGWEFLECSDSDLTETHPHNMITHTHSMTRILARKPL